MKLNLTSQKNSVDSEIIIEQGALSHVSEYLKDHSKAVFIVDKNAFSYLKDYVSEYLAASAIVFELEVNEKTKDIKTIEEILQELKSQGCDRKSLVVAIGGGVLCDVVGYAASSYMRGIEWIAVPTTLIAQADAAIGGKTGVNLDQYKNLVGAFWQPKAVLVDPNMLKTLPENHLRAGMAEVVKMGFIDNKRIIDLVESSSKEKVLAELVQLSAEGKVGIVSDDPLEAGERKLLNFGHTLGHAFESISFNSDKPLLHGEAISIGMLAETKLAELEGICQPSLTDKVRSVLTKLGLPTTFPATDKQEILSRVILDKKNVGGKALWTLPVEVGKGIYNYKASDENIAKAIDFVTD